MCGRFTLTKTKTEIIDYLTSLPISINLDLIDDYTPTLGDRFEILAFVQSAAFHRGDARIDPNQPGILAKT